jgi:hypothetical protein
MKLKKRCFFLENLQSFKIFISHFCVIQDLHLFVIAILASSILARRTVYKCGRRRQILVYNIFSKYIDRFC